MRMLFRLFRVHQIMYASILSLAIVPSSIPTATQAQVACLFFHFVVFPFGPAVRVWMWMWM